MVCLGAACLAAALLDFAHLMSHPGMPAFVTPNGADKAIAFWLMARLLALGSAAHALPETGRGAALLPWTVLGRS